MGTVRVLWLAILTAALALAADPFLGTWKLNTAKSTFSAGWPGPQRRTVVARQDGDWVVYETDAVNGAGQPVKSTNRFKFDGKEYEWNKTVGPRATVTAKRVDNHVIEWVFTDDGAVIKSLTTISKDGKTRTDTLDGNNPEGIPIKNTAVYDKQ